MRTNPLIATLLLFVLSISIGNAQERKTFKSKLESASVFFVGAELTHTSTANLAKGENEIYIEGLSPYIDQNSLKIKTSNGTIISAFEYSIDFLSENKSASLSVKKLQDSIDIYEKRLETINTDIKINSNLIELLQKGTDKNVSGSEKGLGIDELVKTMDYYKTKSTELQNIQTANTKKKTDIEATIGRLKKQLEQENLKNNKSSGVLKLNLTSPNIGACNFTITYYTLSANWVPFYDINIKSTDSPVKFLLKSKVSQTTGLDWDKVKLTLSTATPSSGKIAPLFQTWFLDFNKYATSQMLRGKVTGIMAQKSYSYDMAPAAKELSFSKSKDSEARPSSPLYMVDGEFVDAEYFNSLDKNMIKSSTFIGANIAMQSYGKEGAAGIYAATLKRSMDDFVNQSENDMNLVYTIDIPYTIPGNGKAQVIDLQTKETPAEYKHYCAPRLDSETFLLAEISDWEKLNLLSGKANVTYDGTYVGETTINTKSIFSKLTLTLGTDKRVVVKREKMKDFSSTKFLGNDVKQVFTYKLSVKNNQNKTIKMVLKDQYPISSQKSIEVELLKETSPWTMNLETMGVISWEDDLKAGESKEYTISYSVKYPKGSNINLD